MSLILDVSTLTVTGRAVNFLTVRGTIGVILRGLLSNEDGTEILNEDGSFLVY